MKFSPSWKVIGVVLLGLAALWAIRLIDTIPPHRLASLLGITVTVSDKNAPQPTASDGPSRVGAKNEPLTLSDVAVQTFSGPVLVRQGAGATGVVSGLAQDRLR